MNDKTAIAWKFLDEDGCFALQHPDRTSHLYFPLANDGGMMCSVTPRLRGDAKTGQNSFLLPPSTIEDLRDSNFGRDFWLRRSDGITWSVAGQSVCQRANKKTSAGDSLRIEAGFLWHKTVRENASLGLRAEVVSFVPAGTDHVELMKVVVTNIGDDEQKLTPTAAVPIFGRSADNVRDHRHVTSLLHRIRVTSNGVIVQPTLSFDERGHKKNDISYAVLGADASGNAPVGFFPAIDDFVGEGGNLASPAAVMHDEEPTAHARDEVAGYEAIGAMRFAPLTLKGGESTTYYVALGIGTDDCDDAASYLQANRFENAFVETQAYWSEKLGRIRVHVADENFNLWFKWVTLQPILRRVYGCSFLPYHDYGRGGRGWRDLWQDCLALLLMEPDGVRNALQNHFAGVRMDGSNATIIGNNPGEFLADRNSIARVWMDHGAWPWITTKLYLDQTGDLSFLMEKQSYFCDAHTHRCRKRNESLVVDGPLIHRTAQNKPYNGTLLEHLLIQNLTAFFNVGDHNNLRLEGADWNDGLDMAANRGESVAFTAVYGRNLLEMSQLLEALGERLGVANADLAEECMTLLDTISDPINYESVGQKRELLHRFMDSVVPTVTGKTVSVSLVKLADDLRAKGEWLLGHIRTREYITSKDGHSWFNGYYDDDGRRLEGDHASGIRMTLTGQVFALMSGAATDDQVDQVIASVNQYLWDDAVGGCRLNTDFKEVLTNMGRCYGFAFGHKENGAMFCHMAVMYAYALFTRDRKEEGRRVLDAIYRQCMDFETSRMLPGIPEYFNDRGRGMYPYLTGSASWYLFSVLTQVFGFRGILGDLLLDPALSDQQFGRNGEASVEAEFAGRRLHVTYTKTKETDSGTMKIGKITINGQDFQWKRNGQGALISRDTIEALSVETPHTLRVELE